MISRTFLPAKETACAKQSLYTITEPSKIALWEEHDYSPIFKTRVVKKILRTIKTIAFILGENVLGYLSLDTNYHLFLEAHTSLLRTDNVREQISCIFSRQIEAIVYVPWNASHLPPSA